MGRCPTCFPGMEIAVYFVGFICPVGSSVAGMVKISTRWSGYSSTLLVKIEDETTQKNSPFILCLELPLAATRFTADLYFPA